MTGNSIADPQSERNNGNLVYRILIVDDEPENIRVLGILLKNNGYLVHVVGNGKDALYQARAITPDLILLDVLMPELDGFEVCKRLKADPITSHIPVVFLTAQNDRQAILKGFQLGAVDYITKPFDQVELLVRVQTHTTLGYLTARLRETVEARTLELNSANRRLKQLASELTLAEERERHRLASELHDSTIQRLAAVQLELECAEVRCATDDNKRPIARPIGLLEESIHELRTLIFELSPPVLYELGLDAALDWLAKQAEQRWSIPFDCTIEGDFTAVDQKLSILLFQSARELMLNVGRHSEANQAKLSARRDDTGVIISVEDNGIGFSLDDPINKPPREGGFGLFSIRERMELLGGSLDIRSSDNGSKLTLRLPQ